MDGQAFEVHETHFLLDELLKEIEEIFSMQIEGKGLKFVTSCDFIGEKADLEVFSDWRWIKQVLLNLVSNSNKFTNWGYIEVLVKEEDDDLIKFSVVDTGWGIKEEDKKKLFQELGKGSDKDKVNNQGTGLGLNFCQKILHFLDSHMRISSEEGVGTTAEFTLRFEDSTPKYFQRVSELELDLPIGILRAKWEWSRRQDQSQWTLWL